MTASGKHAAAADPLHVAVNMYGAMKDLFDRTKFADDDERDRSFFSLLTPVFNVLNEWNRPATTIAGAVAALRIVLDEGREFTRTGSLIVPMVEAALPLLENLIEPKPVTETTIEGLFRKWNEIRLTDVPSEMTDEEVGTHQSDYQVLQDAILRVKAVTPRDVALQLMADTDFFGSSHSDQFESVILALAGEVAK